MTDEIFAAFGLLALGFILGWRARRWWTFDRIKRRMERKIGGLDEIERLRLERMGGANKVLRRYWASFRAERGDE